MTTILIFFISAFNLSTYNGTVEVQSQVGQGSTFTLTLPGEKE